jgi:hypothetical protein
MDGGTLSGHMTIEIISRAVNIFRESPASSDHEIYLKIVAGGVEPKYAARLVEFLPMAYCRLIFASTGTRFSDMFRRRLRDGTLSPERMLASEPAWAEVIRFAKTEQGQMTGSELVAVAAHSAEFDALNQLLNRGAKPEDIALTAAVLAWPEEGPTL